jgi:hypothetical protein
MRQPATAKRIAPAAYDALIEALATMYWNRGPFERFLRLALRDCPEVLAGLSFDDYKRRIASDFVSILADNEVKYQAVTLGLMLEVVAMDDFTNLQQQKDRPELLEAARDANAKLRRWTEEYSSLVEAKERLRVEKTAEEARFEARRSLERVLTELKATFLTLHSEADEQRRGREFESLLNELFHLFDLNPRRSFSLTGEQIDGAFTYSTDDYLLEAKWEKDPAARRDVDVLAEVVRRKSKNTLGLFVAVNGFSKPAVDAHANCGSALVFMDGSDLYSVLDGQIPLTDVLEAKRRHLSETGLPLYLVKDMLGH